MLDYFSCQLFDLYCSCFVLSPTAVVLHGKPPHLTASDCEDLDPDMKPCCKCGAGPQPWPHAVTDADPHTLSDKGADSGSQRRLLLRPHRRIWCDRGLVATRMSESVKGRC